MHLSSHSGDKEGDPESRSKPLQDLLGNRMQLVQLRPIIVRELFGTAGCDLGDGVSPSGETNRYGHAFGQYPDFKKLIRRQALTS